MDLITYVTDRKGHDMRYAIDSRKLQKKLCWEPSLQFEEGIEETGNGISRIRNGWIMLLLGSIKSIMIICIVERPSCPSLEGGSLPYTQALNPYHRD